MAHQVSSWVAGQPHWGLSLPTQDAFLLGGTDILTATERSLGDALSNLLHVDKAWKHIHHREGSPLLSKGTFRDNREEQAWACPGPPSSAIPWVLLLTLESWAHLLAASNFMSFPLKQGVGTPYLPEWL